MMHKKGKNHSCRIVPPDILSYLPENVIDAIVIHLPLRDAVRTSILSKKWRYTWCRLQKLTLDQAFWKTTNNLISPTIRFTDIMYHLLTLHVGPLTKFTLSIGDLRNCPKIDNLICFLSRNGIQHLVLQFPKDNLYKLPSSFFTCFQIRHLSLHKCLINPPPAFKGFDKLVALELCEVTISSKFLVSLISYSPLLEQLVLQSSISDHIQIKAPKLISFDFTGSLKLISLMDVPLLAKLSLVDIDEGGSCDIAKFLESFPALEHLHLNCYSVQFLAGKVPKQLLSPLNCLKRLYLSDICLDAVDEASCVLCLIRSSPYLQDIEIQLYDSDSGDDDVMEELAALESREVESFSDVTLNHLRAVKLTGIIGLVPEMELIQLLLAKSPMLIRMLIEPGVGHNSPETRLKVLAEITKFRRASSKAEVVYKVA
ncbi:F-box/FBD/LRR-repeat protein At1g13570-like [Nicotiana sylvestris]|uniref:F-box/FBD/LRR-repeat protein At1g13570-like n=1 Tax=Nicotiana sylvestris TaxID=4096 RepID=A0A1U7YD07_NICSY|nr:PREDICTED: F-box/FBD/LRR-repeat protein At1g13570-like [Nicotiana sylvestris]XP_009801993.1 PREDICTED: F-box/FBD/LRR-repeat protein At1g13570-like [Nicotiana sylvestris]XP_016437355.1 PREDICTED: F-box/FBD/LRR-repeat protein At1g13570-like [Nicotiana tabacum]XP_016437954.1 PREDICTED: F-box/FBD/LRR-repeat protein At1g13570-like [Nicotiana tabacum]